MNKVNRIALIAHDNKKAEMVSWAMKNRDTLARFGLCGTGTTAKLVAEATGLDVERYLSGPLGGDQQIGAKIAEGQIDLVIFFWDPLQAQPHDPDVKALLRIAGTVTGLLFYWCTFKGKFNIAFQADSMLTLYLRSIAVDPTIEINLEPLEPGCFE